MDQIKAIHMFHFQAIQSEPHKNSQLATASHKIQELRRKLLQPCSAVLRPDKTTHEDLHPVSGVVLQHNGMTTRKSTPPLMKTQKSQLEMDVFNSMHVSS